MEIKLNDTQLQILGKIQTEKQALQAEFSKVTQRETEVLILICNAAGAELAQGTQIEMKEGGILVVPDLKVHGVAEPKKNKKTKE